jgi:hypothetical protein
MIYLKRSGVAEETPRKDGLHALCLVTPKLTVNFLFQPEDLEFQSWFRELKKATQLSNKPRLLQKIPSVKSPPNIPGNIPNGGGEKVMVNSPSNSEKSPAR